jgi:hypothetical protein
MSSVKKVARGTRNLKQSGAIRVISHRPGTKAAKAHLFVREHRAEEREAVIGEMKRRYRLTEGTARNWYQSFVKSPMDFAVAGARRA